MYRLNPVLRSCLAGVCQNCTLERRERDGASVVDKVSSRSDLVRDKVRQRRSQLRSEFDDAFTRGVNGFRGEHGANDADDGAIGAIHADGVEDHVELGGVLVGDAAAVRLVPVHDKFAVSVVADDVLANVIDTAVGSCEVGVTPGVKVPTGAGEAVLRGMDGLPRALGGEVTDEEADGNGLRGSGGGSVEAIEKVALAKDIEDVLANGDVVAGKPVDVCGDEAKRLAVGYAVGVATGMENECGTEEEESDGPKASRFHIDQTS